MRVLLRLPPALSERIGSRGELRLQGDTVEGCLQAAAERYPVLGKLLWPAGTTLNPVLHIFHGNELLHQADLQRPVNDGDVIDVIPAIEGG